MEWKENLQICLRVVVIKKIFKNSIIRKIKKRIILYYIFDSFVDSRWNYINCIKWLFNEFEIDKIKCHQVNNNGTLSSLAMLTNIIQKLIANEL